MSKYTVTIEGFTYEIELGLIMSGESRIVVDVDGESVEVLLAGSDPGAADQVRMFVDGRPYEASFDHDRGWIQSKWGIHSVEVEDLESTHVRPVTGDGRVKAPIPGQISQLLVEVGSDVVVGQPLLILEAMKMENEIRAPRAGTIERINIQPGQVVSLNQVLVEIV